MISVAYFRENSTSCHLPVAATSSVFVSYPARPHSRRHFYFKRNVAKKRSKTRSSMVSQRHTVAWLQSMIYCARRLAAYAIVLVALLWPVLARNTCFSSFFSKLVVGVPTKEVDEGAKQLLLFWLPRSTPARRLGERCEGKDGSFCHLDTDSKSG